MVKDDIGNWYVKSYSADPEPIIKAAKNLALFNLSGGADPSVLKQAVDGGKEGAGSSTGAGTPAKTGIQQVFEKYKANYDAATEGAVSDVAAMPAGLGDAIRIGWESDTELKRLSAVPADGTPEARDSGILGKLAQILKQEIDNLDAEIKLKLKNDKVDYGERIVGSLQAVRRSYGSLEKAVGTTGGSELALTRARNLAKEKYRAYLEDRTRMRQQTVKSFATAISFLGEASGK